MKDMQESESGYIGLDTDDCGIGASLTDVEIISTSGTNVIARGRTDTYPLSSLRPGERESPTTSTVWA